MPNSSSRPSFRPETGLAGVTESTEDAPFLALLIPPRAAVVQTSEDNPRTPFLQAPLLGPLLFPNTSSDARDHAANERTFLSWLRLAIYLAVVSVAIVISFHLKQQPTALELKISLPLGIVFWLLSLACLASGVANYIRTVTRYSRRAALVQSGWKTQLVFTVLTTTIMACCILFLSMDLERSS